MNKSFVILTFFVIILLSFKLTFFALNFYTDNPDSKNIIDYLKNRAELSKDISERERLHLEDVKNLITYTNIIFYSLLIIYGFSLFNLKTKIPKTLITSGKISLFAVIILLILILFSFEPAFIGLHHLLFRNDLWMLPQGSTLLQLFPKSFFNIFIRIVFVLALIGCIGLILIGKGIKRFLKPNIYENARGEGGAK